MAMGVWMICVRLGLMNKGDYCRLPSAPSIVLQGFNETSAILFFMDLHLVPFKHELAESVFCPTLDRVVGCTAYCSHRPRTKGSQISFSKPRQI
jgi:hypothetical protein